MTGSEYRSIEVDEEYDGRVPLHADEAFLKGISYKAKYIGTLEIPKPTTRLDIVSSMRRIRYEFKARNVKKKQVSLLIGADGLKVYRKRKRRRRRKRKNLEKHLLFSHPIYRIFYVSHDSQDLKIFSLIARESQSSNFTCSVFKAKKKRHAIRVVRTIGQAFDICHKLMEDESETVCTASQACSNVDESEMSELLINTDLPPYESTDKMHFGLQKPTSLFEMSSQDSGHEDLGQKGSFTMPDISTLSVQDGQQFHRELCERIEEQQRRTTEIIKEARVLREELSAERAARLSAQTRSQQLHAHNRQLLAHIDQLVRRLCSSDGSQLATAASQLPPLAVQDDDEGDEEGARHGGRHAQQHQLINLTANVS